MDETIWVATHWILDSSDSREGSTYYGIRTIEFLKWIHGMDLSTLFSMFSSPVVLRISRLQLIAMKLDGSLYVHARSQAIVDLYRLLKLFLFQ